MDNKMAFVNEEIPEERKKELDARWWTIDRDRNAFLISRGTNREDFTTFEFYWKNEIIKIIAYTEIGNGFLINYSIFRLGIPKSLHDYKKIIIPMLKEAISEFGFAYDRNDGAEVNIIFPKNYQY